MSQSRYTIQQRVWIIKQKYLVTHPISIQRQWKKEFNSDAPTRRTINLLFDKWERTGSVLDAPRSGRPVLVTSEDNHERVRQHYENHPQTSSRRGSSQLEISSTSLRRILKDLKMRHYIPRLVQSLNEDDYDRRLQFCEEMLMFMRNNPQLIDRIIWSDEATFHVDGVINRHNSVYYAKENPHQIVTKGVASPGLCIWAAIHSQGVIGPYFFDGTCNAERYVEMLSIFFLPALQALVDSDSYIFQQDGAPPHFANITRAWLNGNLDDRWIGRRGTYCEWPPRSPDLSVPDFFLWGFLKNRVYKHLQTPAC